MESRYAVLAVDQAEGKAGAGMRQAAFHRGYIWVALAMAIGRAMAGPQTFKSIYETQGVEFI